jgi:hypothetical protein
VEENRVLKEQASADLLADVPTGPLGRYFFGEKSMVEGKGFIHKGSILLEFSRLPGRKGSTGQHWDATIRNNSLAPPGGHYRTYASRALTARA